MNFKIYEPNAKTLTEKLTRLNAKLARIGLPLVTWKQVSYVDEPHPSIENAVARYLNFEVEGTSPVFNGWEFVATLVHTTDGNILRSVPGFTVPVEYRDRTNWCDHCKTNRLRRDTYIVRNQDGRVMQVGSSCLEEFIGCNPAGLTKGAELLLSAYDVCESATKTNWLGGHNGLQTFRIDLETFLKHVAAVVAVEKRYITRKSASENNGISTSDKAYRLMMGYVGFSYDTYPLTPEVEKLARTARSFVLAKFSPHLGDADEVDDGAALAAIMNTLKGVNVEISDFEHNLLACARAESIEPRLCGVAAYIVEYYRRNNEEAQARRNAVLDGQGLLRIFAMIKKAGDHLKHPAIRLANDQGVNLSITLAGPQSKNAGCLYVKGERGADSYYGKVTPAGKFFPVASCPDTVEPLLTEFGKDPETIATKYGRLTDRCSFCGRKLSAEESTSVGFGPVCAVKFGMAYGSKKDEPAKAETTPTAVAA